MTVDLEIIEKCKTDYVSNDTQNRRYYSWHLCYQEFKQAFASNTKDKEKLALILGFYLLSWGMGRNSKLMKDYNYRIHLAAIDILFKYKDLSKKGENWAKCEKDGSGFLEQYADEILELKDELAKYYKKNYEISPTDTLISKIILGTLGCVPAYDNYFREGMRGEMDHTYAFNTDSIKELWKFYKNNEPKLEELNTKLQKVNGNKDISYTPMKLVDIYFWTRGKTFIKVMPPTV